MLQTQDKQGKEKRAKNKEHGAKGKMRTGADLAKAVKESILKEYPGFAGDRAMDLAVMLTKLELDDENILKGEDQW